MKVKTTISFFPLWIWVLLVTFRPIFGMGHGFGLFDGIKGLLKRSDGETTTTIANRYKLPPPTELHSKIISAFSDVFISSMELSNSQRSFKDYDDLVEPDILVKIKALNQTIREHINGSLIFQFRSDLYFLSLGMVGELDVDKLNVFYKQEMIEISQKKNETQRIIDARYLASKFLLDAVGFTETILARQRSVILDM